MDYRTMDKAGLQKIHEELRKKYEALIARKLNLDMTRGKPSAEQLELSNAMLDLVGAKDFKSADGTDCRNYGGLDGLPEAKKLFGELLEAAPEEIIVGGNSSLSMMAEVLFHCVLAGAVKSTTPWGRLPKVKFLCPSPGYDRHFSILEYLGIEMIPVEMNEEGPDMVSVEGLAKSDDAIKGIFCVPKYSNPTGITYSDRVVDALAGMKTAAQDFVILWDNAYAVHHLGDKPDRLKNLLEACKKAGNPERPLIFGSTSKLTFAGGGVAVLAGSTASMDWARKQLFIQTIGPDKLNQLRHCRFFKDMQDIEAHMKRHAAIVKPRFDAVLNVLDRDLGGSGLAEWTKPNGGYFVSLNVPDGCARKVIELSAKAGVKLTPAGSTYPYKKDPQDRNIRLAPTFPSLQEIGTAMEVVTVCVRLAGVEKILSPT